MYFHKLAVSFCLSATVMVGFVPSMPGAQAQVSSISLRQHLVRSLWKLSDLTSTCSILCLEHPPSFSHRDCIILLLTEHRI
jgi:hypothetical protein